MEEKQTIYLEAAWHRDHLKIGIHEPDDTFWNYQDASVPMENVQSLCREMTESLNRKNRRDGGTEAMEKIRDAGRMFFSELLSQDVKERLNDTKAEYLILRIDEHLVHIPWELICIGDEFLCQRFSMGRLVQTRQKIIRQPNKRDIGGRPLDMWILANPEGNLVNAHAEGKKIFKTAKQLNSKPPLIFPRLDTKITSDRARQRFQNYDVVHFAGHAEYDLENPHESGWQLTEGRFTAAHIHKMAGGAAMPSLVFSNACQTARTESWEPKDGAGDSFGLANAFLFAGTRHYIGTFWEVTDDPSREFALAFYGGLFSGEPVGKAMRDARLALMDVYGPDSAGWTSYLLYGDPRVSYIPRDGQVMESSTPDPSVSRPRPVTRGGIRGWYETQMRGSKILFAACLLLLLGGGMVSAQMYMHFKDGQVRAQLAREHQAETRDLIRELRKDMPAEQASAGEQTSAPLSMAILYDSVGSAYSQGQEGVVSSAIAQQIQKRYPPSQGKGVRLVERKELRFILEELRLLLAAFSENRLRPKLLNAKLILFLEVHESFFSSTTVHMRLLDTETGEMIVLPARAVNVERMASQDMTEPLLETLKANYGL